MTSWDSREMRLKVMLSPSPLVRNRGPVRWQAGLGHTKEASGAPSWAAKGAHYDSLALLRNAGLWVRRAAAAEAAPAPCRASDSMS